MTRGIDIRRPGWDHVGMPNPFDSEAVAATYDADSASMSTPEVLGPTVDLLAQLAGGGSALEFAIGTGRVGLPLSRRGVDVQGIELSAAMAARLAAKPGGDRIPVLVDDMATARVEGRFDLVYLVFNSITNLLTQEQQVACFQNAARHLRPGGVFLIEVFVPQIRRIPLGEDVAPFDVSENHIGIDRYDLVTQRLTSFHYTFDDSAGRASTFQSTHRYAWPAEYDLMAQLAGMRLRDRWAGWDRSEFTADSTSHVSVFELLP